jgi:hypothetical protein
VQWLVSDDMLSHHQGDRYRAMHGEREKGEMGVRRLGMEAFIGPLGGPSRGGSEPSNEFGELGAVRAGRGGLPRSCTSDPYHNEKLKREREPTRSPP